MNLGSQRIMKIRYVVSEPLCCLAAQPGEAAIFEGEPDKLSPGTARDSSALLDSPRLVPRSCRSPTEDGPQRAGDREHASTRDSAAAEQCSLHTDRLAIHTLCDALVWKEVGYSFTKRTSRSVASLNSRNRKSLSFVFTRLSNCRIRSRLMPY